MKKTFAHFIFIFSFVAGFAQWQPNGTAVSLGGNCYQMTQQFNGQVASLWNTSTIDLSQPFDISFWIRINGGADGIVFLLQNAPGPTTITSTGGGSLGYMPAILPSMAVEIDIYDNGPPNSDIPADHIAFHPNASPVAIAGPVQADPGTTNIGDNVCRNIRVSWDPVTFNLSCYLNGGLRLTTNYNMVANLFSGNPNVYWGFTSSTGGVNAEQIICLEFANAGNDTSTCFGTPLNLNATAGNTFTWTELPGNTAPTGFSCSNCFNPVFNPAIYQASATYRVEVANAYGCIDHDTIVISQGLGPSAANAGPDQTLCNATTTNLAAVVPAVGTGAWAVVSGTGVVSNPSSANSPVTGLTPGTHIFRWNVTDPGCPPNTDLVSIIIQPLPTTANAGADQNICTTSATLAANTPLVGSGQWAIISGGGFVVSPFNPGSNANGLLAGPHVFQWTITNGLCPPSTDQVTITVDPNPTTSNAGPDQSLCNATTATLAANTPGTGTGTWVNISGTGVATSPSNPNSGVTGLTPGTHVFQWTVTSGTCPANSDQVSIFVDALPTVSMAGIDQTVCATSAVLAGNVPATGTGLWTIISGSPVITTPTNAGSSVTGLSPGSYVLQWTISNGVCPPSSDQVSISVDANPTVANAGTDQVLCNVSTTSLSGNVPGIGSGTWSVVSGTGLPVLPSDPNSTVTGLTAGNTLFQWTISNGVCPPSSDQVNIQVDDLPTVANAGTDTTFCNSSTTLAGNLPLVGSGNWAIVSGAGNVTTAGNPSSTVTGLVPGTTILSWTITNGSCPPSTDQVTLTIDANPTVANAGPDQNLCNVTQTTMAGNSPAIGTGTWTVISPPGGFSNPGNPNATLVGLSAGNSLVQWTISNGTCPATSDQVIIHVDELPTVSNAGPDIQICDYEFPLLTGNTPFTGNGIWTGPAGISNPANPSTLVNGLAAGNYVYTWTISNGVCPPSSDAVSVVVIQTPDANFQVNDTRGCIPFTVLFNNLSNVGQGFTWNFGDGTTQFVPSNGQVSHTFTSAGTFTVTLLADNTGCKNLESQLNLIETGEVPIADFSSSPAIPVVIPAGTTVSYSNLSRFSDSWTWDFGDGGTSTDLHPVHKYMLLGDYCTKLTAYSSFGCQTTVEQCSLEVLTGNVFFPTGFTPNDDGLNDSFSPVTNVAFIESDFSIFDRWGKLVFNTTTVIAWNGKINGRMAPEGAYAYRFTGTTIVGTKVNMNGTVTVVR